jgi:uncharacterized protein YjbI with pentapeptide repeats
VAAGVVKILNRETGEVLFEHSGKAEIDETPAQALGRTLIAAVAAGVDLTGAELRDVDATGANLRGAKLAEANVTGGVFDRADLSHADLANLTGLRLSAHGANFSRATMHYAHLWAAELDGADLTSVDAADASFDSAQMPGAQLTGGNFDGADFADASMAGVLATGADFTHATLTSADLRGADFRRTVLLEADLVEVAMEGLRLDNADLTRTDFGPLTLAGRAPTPDGGELFAWRSPRWGDQIAHVGETLTLADFTARLADPAYGATSALRNSFALLLADLRRLDKAGGLGAKASFGWKRRWLTIAAPGAALAGAFAGWMGWLIWTDQMGDFELSHKVILTLMMGAFALLLLTAGFTYLLALFDPRPVVILDAAGVHDRRLTDAPVSWSDLRSLGPMQMNGQDMLALEVERPQRYGLSRYPLFAVNRLSARLLRRPELVIRLTGLDADMQGVIDAIQAAAPEPTAP